jgi:hypothetical protein
MMETNFLVREKKMIFFCKKKTEMKICFSGFSAEKQGQGKAFGPSWGRFVCFLVVRWRYIVSFLFLNLFSPTKLNNSNDVAGLGLRRFVLFNYLKLFQKKKIFFSQ